MTEAEWLSCKNPERMLSRLKEVAGDWGNHTFVPSDRKLRLFAVACCRQVWHLLTDPRSRKAVEVAERFADGAATHKEVNITGEGATRVYGGVRDDDAKFAAAVLAERLLHRCTALVLARSVVGTAENDMPTRAGCIPATQADLLREIVGNPFRPVTFRCHCTTLRHFPDGCEMCEGDRTLPHPRYEPWLTPQVLSLAQAAYKDRPGRGCERCDGHLDPMRLMVLADALEEAGCEGEPAWHPQTGRLQTQSPILTHLRSPGPHVRGCWALDLILGKS